MRELFTKSFDNVMALVVVFMIFGLLISVFNIARLGFVGLAPVAVISILLGGFVSIVMTVGGLYLLHGIYENTKRSAEAAEALLRQSNPEA